MHPDSPGHTIPRAPDSRPDRNLIVFLVAVILFVIVGVVTERTMLGAAETARQVEHAFSTLSQLNQISEGVEQDISATRGFILTGTETFLNVSAAARARLRAAQVALEAAALDSVQSRELSVLREQLDRRLALSDAYVEIRRANDLERTATLIPPGGEALVTQIRDTIERITLAERQSLAEQLATADRRTTAALATFIAGGGLGVVLLAFVFHTLRGQVAMQTRAEATLRLSEAELTAAQRLGQIGSWSWDAETKSGAWSREMYRIMGRSPDLPPPSLDEHIARFTPASQAVLRQHIEAIRAAPQAFEAELTLDVESGPPRSVVTRGRSEADPIAGTLRIVGTTQDVSEQRRLATQLQQAQKLEAIGQLAGGVAHDFNNILTAMIMQTDLILQSPNLDPDVRADVQPLREYADRAANLTRQLLLFSRRQVMQPRVVDLNDVVRELARMLKRIIGEHYVLDLRLSAESLSMQADPGMLDQVLMNLVVNARDAMRGGGSIVIETAPRTLSADAALRVPDVVAGRYACITVSDAGEGIAPENLPRIFEPFFTTKEVGKGTGLGLATVFGIVKQHGGGIHVSSAPGKGTTFEIYLPVAEAVREEADVSVVDAAPGGSETILLVEDQDDLRRLARRTLERKGYRVHEAASGVEALRIWKEASGSVQLLVTDMVMPGGLTGAELAAFIRQDLPSLRVIFTSGYTGETAVPDRSAAGTRFLQKPFSMQTLLMSVRRALDA